MSLKNRVRYLYFAAGFLVALTLSAGLGALASSAVARIQPVGWNARVALPETNSSYIVSSDTNPDRNKISLRDQWMDSRLTVQMKQQFEDMTRDYDLKRSYGILDQQNHLNQRAQMEGFANYVLKTVFTRQLGEFLKRAEKTSAEVRTFTRVQEQVQSVVQSNLAVQVEESLNVGLSTNLPMQSGTLWLKSPFVDGEFTVSVGTPWIVDPGALTYGEQAPHAELYRLSLRRGIPVVDATASLNYAGTSGHLSLGVSKDLAPGLRCDVTAIRNTNNLAAGGDEMISLLYGVRF